MNHPRRASGSGSNSTTRPHDLPSLLRFQQEACGASGSTVYERVIGRTADRVGAAGPIRELLAPHVDDPFGSALALRYLAAVHRIVLEGRAPALAAHYPSMGGTPGSGLEDAFEATVATHADELARSIESGVQTNEVGRSATLVGALLDVGRRGLPLRVFELGSSAGLNLRWDHYRYEAGAESFGPVASPVRFVEPWVDHRPRLAGSFEAAGARADGGGPVAVVERRGCDRSPIDATTAEGRTLLRSFVWPDLVERFARLDAAIAVAREVPATVDRADATAWAAARLAEPVVGTATVLMHSIVMQYLSVEGRHELVQSIIAAGARATDRAPLAWIRLEPGRAGAELRSTIWPGGAERLLAVSSFHGPPVRWIG